MLKLFQRWLPVFIVIATIFNLIASYGADNFAAFGANITALAGWVAIVADEFIGSKKSADIT
jgi:hypothetical protein